jgi:hypothetical protein
MIFLTYMNCHLAEGKHFIDIPIKAVMKTNFVETMVIVRVMIAVHFQNYK